MIECAMVMVDDVLEHTAIRSDLHVEEHLDISNINSQCNGTPDVWMFNGTLHLWDYKFGHKDVPADSWQNKTYTAGILKQLGIDGLADQSTKVIMTIVQPRSFNEEGPIKRFECTASDLRADFNRLTMQAENAVSPVPNIQSGPHCRYCTARHSCPAAREAASAAVDYAGFALPEELDNDALSFELALLERGRKAIDYRYDAIKTLALTRIDKGDVIPGYGFKSGLGNRKWTGSVKEIATLGNLLGMELLASPTTITPAEFDRQLKAVNKQRKKDGLEVIDKSVINAYVERPSTGKQLVPSEETLAIRAFKPK